MYAFIWRHLPGPVPVRVLLAAALLLAVIVLLFTWVFPWLMPLLPIDDVSLDAVLLSPGVPLN